MSDTTHMCVERRFRDQVIRLEPTSKLQDLSDTTGLVSPIARALTCMFGDILWPQPPQPPQPGGVAAHRRYGRDLQVFDIGVDTTSCSRTCRRKYVDPSAGRPRYLPGS
jgi:hypothetical protein